MVLVSTLGRSIFSASNGWPVVIFDKLEKNISSKKSKIKVTTAKMQIKNTDQKIQIIVTTVYVCVILNLRV